jgi:uncharacterized protein YuzE
MTSVSTGTSAMKIKYFPQTDTPFIEFRNSGIVATSDIDENTQVELDAQGAMCGITFEHASQRTDLSNLSFEQVAG